MTDSHYHAMEIANQGHQLTADALLFGDARNSLKRRRIAAKIIRSRLEYIRRKIAIVEDIVAEELGIEMMADNNEQA